MAGNKYIVDWDTITRFVTEAFEKYGIPEEEAKICTDVLPMSVTIYQRKKKKKERMA